MNNVNVSRIKEDWLIVKFSGNHSVLSWAVVRGGKCEASSVVWLNVNETDLTHGVDPANFLAEKIKNETGIENTVGLMTHADLDRYCDVEYGTEKIRARCIATVALGNAVRIGEPSHAATKVGTINLLCLLSSPLSDAAQLEVMSLAAEARTTAVIEAGLPGKATGTGTDCIVIASPLAGDPVIYAGKHTDAGYAAGRAVYDAVSRGIRKCRGSRE